MNPFRAVLYGLLYAFFWLFIKVFYRIRVEGLPNLPATGPALILCNHVSFADGLFLYFVSPRPIRFMVWAPYFKQPIFRLLLGLVRAIPIDGEGDAKNLIRSLRGAIGALKQGEIVCIFAEGSLSRSGAMLPFRRGFEQILKRAPAPVIPACSARLWGSISSYRGGKPFWKRPRRFRYPVTILLGQPMPATSQTWQVRQAVQKLLADSFSLRKYEHKAVHRQFVRMACRYPFRMCFIDPLPGGRELSAMKVLVGAAIMAKHLRPKLDDNPNVGLLMPTVLGGALVNVAVSLMGRTAVNLNYTASRESILSAMKQCGLKKLVTSRAFLQKLNMDLGSDVEYVILEDLRKEITKFEQLRTLLTFMLLPGWVVEHWVLRLGGHHIDDIATIIFSSGSTGEPKGVMLSHHNIISNVEQAAQAMNIGPHDRLLAVLPFFHSFGYTITLWTATLVGASIVYYPDPRQAKEIGEFCQKYACTIFVATPTFLRFYLRRCEPEQFRSLRMLVTGAEKLPIKLAQEFEAKFGMYPFEGYGCTELAPGVSANMPDVDVNGVRQIGHKRGTIGQPFPGVAVKIVDPDTMAPLPPGEPGMLLVAGPNVMTGYLGRADLTAKAMHGEWYITGDIAKLDEDGFLQITDRLSRFSKIAGEMVPHQRVEDEIQTILDNQERVCAVVGVPDEKKGERIVVLHAPLENMTVPQIVARLNQSGLPNLWLPDERSFFEVPEIPILGTGKLDLQTLKKKALELTGATS
ncbi:MAG TPA: AMP-binding protein [Gemmatales bacterium]|nr:AMP-binding protein [Gemmatales bacterium]